MSKSLKELMDNTSPEIVKRARKKANDILTDMKEREEIIKELEILETTFAEQRKTTKKIIHLLKRKIK